MSGRSSATRGGTGSTLSASDWFRAWHSGNYRKPDVPSSDGRPRDDQIPGTEFACRFAFLWFSEVHVVALYVSTYRRLNVSYVKKITGMKKIAEGMPV
jgi:hypothetical protein